MKKIYRTKLLTVASALALLAGCNTDYNFDQLSLEVTVGDTEGIIVPLGSTGEIKVADLLSETALETDEEGYYSFSTDDSFSYTVEIGTIEPISDLIPSVESQTFEVLGNLDVKLSDIKQTAELPLPGGLTSGLVIPANSFLVGMEAPLTVGPDKFEHTFEVGIPEQVTQLGQIVFGPKGEGSPIDVILNLNNLYAVTEERVIDEFVIEMPAGFTLGLEPGDTVGKISKGEGSETNNRYTISNCEVDSDKYHIGFLVKSVDMSHAVLKDGKTTVSTDIEYGFTLHSTIKAGEVAAQMPSIEATANISFHSATVTTGLFEHEVNVPAKTISQVVEVPKELTRIEYLSIGDAANPSQKPVLDIKLGLEGAPVEAVDLKDIAITLPSFIDIEAPQNWTLSNSGSNQVLSCSLISILNDETTQMLRLPINGIKKLPIDNGKINLSGAVGLSAVASIAAGQKLTIDTSSKDIVITPSISLSDIAIQEVTGIVDPDLSSLIEPQEIDLSDFSKILSEASLDLNLCSPVVNLTVENPIGVGIAASAKISAFKDNQEVAQAMVDINFRGAEGDTPAVTNLTISADPITLPDHPDYAAVYLPELFDIINALPEKITIELNAETNKQQFHKLVLKDSYTFKADYSVSASVKFNPQKEGHLSYSTIINDVDLSDVSDMGIDLLVDSLTLNVEALSTLPVDALLAVEFLDENENPIPQIQAQTTGLIKGSSTSEATTSTISIGLALKPLDNSNSTLSCLSLVKKLRCTFEGATLPGGGLKPDQSLSATLWLTLDDGICVDFGPMLNAAQES